MGVIMDKYGFILNAEGLDPEKYTGTFSSAAFSVKVCGVASLDAAVKTAEKMAEEGIKFIDLCGDYDQQKADRIQAAVKGRAEVAFAKYNKEEQSRLAGLNTLSEYGFIVIAEGLNPEKHRLVLTAPGCNTYVVGTESIGQAKAAADDLIKRGVHFIELCSGFDEALTGEIIKTANGRVPVGSAGL
jgi:hypothetical protein